MRTIAVDKLQTSPLGKSLDDVLAGTAVKLGLNGTVGKRAAIDWVGQLLLKHDNAAVKTACRVVCAIR